MDAFFQKQQELFAGGDAFVAVTLVDAAGSVPQDAGAKMLVTAAGLYAGTVGGGRVEAQAIELARAMLADSQANASEAATRFVDWSLQKDVGMTCGGRVKLYFERFNRPAWEIALFGAGHVALALVPLLLGFDLRLRVHDPREDWLAKLPAAPLLTKVRSDEPAGLVAGLPPEAFVLLMTQGHATDLPVLIEVLRTERPFPYVGVIGSKSKRAVLERELRAAGITEERIASFYCPIGLPIGSNHPREIAVSIAAQLLEVRDWTRNEAGT